MTIATETRVRVRERELVVRNLDKVLWPEDGLTKGDYLHYCLRVAPWVLPHLRNRPLVLTRYPDGVESKGFYQKDAPEHTPEWVRLHPYWSEDAGRWIRFIVCDEAPTLVWIASQAALEFHPWLSQIGSLERPDFAVIDLDPAEGVGYREAAEVASLVRELLRHLGIRGYPKTSGATGIHIYIPLERRYAYRAAADFVRRIGVLLRAYAPERITLERAVKKRAGRVYVDHLQNVLGKTLVSVYAARPRAGATVSFPLTWAELSRSDPREFTLRNVPGTLERVGDRFAPVLKDRQRIDEASLRLDRLLATRPRDAERQRLPLSRNGRER